jgi:transposase-like protein
MNDIIDENIEEFKKEISYDYNFDISCPYCNSNEIDYKDIEIFNRDGANNKYGNYYRINENTIVSHYDVDSDNPSSYKNGLKIWFKCNKCNETFTLNLTQNNFPTQIKLFWKI